MGAHNSFEENAKPIVFHAQMLANFNTVDELARKMLDELAKPATDERPRGSRSLHRRHLMRKPKGERS
jgi:hypothetical protein